MTITEKYGITLRSRVIEFITGKEIRKSVLVNNDVLGELMNGWKRADALEEQLLPDIEEALANPDAELENGAASIYIYIYHDVVKFYTFDDNSGGKIVSDFLRYEMPTTDLKEVALIWRDFLNTPPYSSTKA